MDISAAAFHSAGHLRPDPAWYMDAHFHPFHEIIVIVAGKMAVIAGGEHITASAGDVLLYPAQMPHEERADPGDPVESYFASFSLPDVPCRLLRMHDADARVRRMIRWIHDDHRRGRESDAVKLRAWMQAIVAELFEERDQAEDSLVTRTREFIRGHLSEPLTLDSIARNVSVSKFHFLRLYRAATGHTPMDDVRAIRLDHARDLLLTTSLPIKEIAWRCGLGNEHSLSRLFRRRFSMPPGEFRKHVAGHG